MLWTIFVILLVLWLLGQRAEAGWEGHRDVPPPRRPTRTVRRRPRFACSTCRGDPRLDGPLAEAGRCLSGPRRAQPRVPPSPTRRRGRRHRRRALVLTPGLNAR